MAWLCRLSGFVLLVCRVRWTRHGLDCSPRTTPTPLLLLRKRCLCALFFRAGYMCPSTLCHWIGCTVTCKRLRGKCPCDNLWPVYGHMRRGLHHLHTARSPWSMHTCPGDFPPLLHRSLNLSPNAGICGQLYPPPLFSSVV